MYLKYVVKLIVLKHGFKPRTSGSGDNGEIRDNGDNKITGEDSQMEGRQYGFLGKYKNKKDRQKIFYLIFSL